MWPEEKRSQIVCPAVRPFIRVTVRLFIRVSGHSSCQAQKGIFKQHENV